MNGLTKTALVTITLVATAAGQGVSDNEILLGQSCALRGPASSLGTGMRTGLEVYFARINAQGGVQGRKVSLLSLNDGYEPKKAKITTRMLIDKKKVFALIGEVGTPTSKVAVPIAEQKQVPFVAPFTGAEFLRNPYKKWVVNLRGSYYQEMEALAAHLVDELGFERIACFYQNDGYGKAGLAGIEKALARRKLELCGTGTYRRNTIAVRKGVLDIAKCSPDAVVMVGAYQPCAQFIKSAKKESSLAKSTFCNISFVGTKALTEELGSAGEGCIISQVVPYPWNTNVPLVAEYTKAMQKAGKAADIGFISLEGYMAAKLFCQVMEQVAGTPTREAFIAAIAKTKTFDLGGVMLQFGKEDHQGMDEVFLTVIRKGKAIPLTAQRAAPGK